MAVAEELKLIQEVDEARRRLSEAQKALDEYRLAHCGVSIGEIVLHKGEEYQVTSIDPRWSPPWLKACKKRANGTFEKRIKHLYDNWQKKNHIGAHKV